MSYATTGLLLLSDNHNLQLWQLSAKNYYKNGFVESKNCDLQFFSTDQLVKFLDHQTDVYYIRKVDLLTSSKVFVEDGYYTTNKLVLGCKKVFWLPKSLEKQAVLHDGMSVRYVKNPSYELCLEAVKQNGLAMRYIANPDVYINFGLDEMYKICLAAVKQNGTAIKYVPSPNRSLYLAAVKQKGITIKSVPSPTPKMCFSAVRQNGMCIRFVPKPTYDMCLEAVKQNGLALRFVSDASIYINFGLDQMIKICTLAIKQNKEALRFSPVITSKMCYTASKWER